MTPLERLMAELIPTRPASAQPWGHWTTEEQDAHWAELCKEVGTPGAPRPHLRLITDTDAA